MPNSPEAGGLFMGKGNECNAVFGGLQLVKAALDPETRTSRERAQAYLDRIPLCPYIGIEGKACRMRWRLQPDDNRLSRYDADDPTAPGTCLRLKDEHTILPKDVRVDAVLQSLEASGRTWATELRQRLGWPGPPGTQHNSD